MTANKPHVIVDHIVNNLLDRRGIKSGFEGLDDDVTQELFSTLETIVERGMRGGLEDKGCWLRPRCHHCDNFDVKYHCEKCDVILCNSRDCTNSAIGYDHLVLCNDCYDTIKDEYHDDVERYKREQNP